ncbi:hypothetical protein EalM132_00046 [Exiguobacterium phage vB_EalM-132]|nr:hypothetical protein EalM132_00046 [Exiguobacterium phage vB_EalM-132]
MEFVYANYSPDEIETVAEFTTLKLVGYNDTFNVLVDGNGQHCVAFANQTNLSKEILKNPRGLFLVRYLKPGNTKESYRVDKVLEVDYPVNARTIGAVLLISPVASPKFEYAISVDKAVVTVTPVYVKGE